MSAKSAYTGFLVEDLVDIMLEIDGNPDRAQEKKAKEAFSEFTERFWHGLELIRQQPAFQSFWSASIQAAQEGQDNTLQARLGLTDEEMVEMYGFAKALYDQGKFKDAQDVLLTLCMCNPFMAFFWQALGMSQEADSDYKGAILSYAVALEKDDSLLPALYTARCLGRLGLRSDAQDALDQALSLAPASEEFKKQAQEIRNSLG